MTVALALTDCAAPAEATGVAKLAGAVIVTVTEMLSELVPSLTVTEKTRLRSASSIAIAGAVNVGLAADVSLRATVVPEVWVQA